MIDLVPTQQGRDVVLYNLQACEVVGISPPDAQWLHTDYWTQRAHGKPDSGRGEAVIISEPAPMVLRTYCRGGLVRHFSQRRFMYNGLDATRPFRELQLLHTMHQAGLPVPLGLAGRVSRFGLAYEAAILMQQIPRCKEVHQRIQRNAMPNTLWQGMGEVIRRMHDIQVYHHDLNIHNILIDDEDALWLIDFDKCGQKSGHQWKHGNLERLQRSLLKEQAKSASTYYFNDDNWQALLNGYQQPIASSPNSR